MECGEMILSQNCMEFFVQYPYENNILDVYGADCAQVIDRKYAVVYYDVSDEVLRKFQSERYVSYSFPRCFGPSNAEVLEAVGISSLRRNPNFDLYGRDVIIGIVDTGINYNEKVFKNADNSTKIISAWDQNEYNGNSPEGFIYGTYYTRDDINEVLSLENPYSYIPINDEIGHGSIIAALSAGSSVRYGAGNEQRFTGTAQEADICIVKLKPAKKYLRDFYYINEQAVCYQETDIVLGIKFLLGEAAKFKKPIAIVVALGTNLGGHNGTGTLDEFLRYASGLTGVCVLAAAGNEGGRGLHYKKSYSLISGLQGEVQQEPVQIRVGANERGFTLGMYASPPSLYRITIISPTGQRIERGRIRVDTKEELVFLLDGSRIFFDAYVLDRRTGGEAIILRFDKPSQGIWSLEIVPENFANGAYFNMWLPIHDFLTSDTYFLNPSPNETITNPANEEAVITISGYDMRTGAAYIYSGRGFSANGSIKPDISAPAVSIQYPDENGFEGVVTGTGAAAAISAGAAALLLEWGIVRGNRPTIDTAEIKLLFIRGAKPSGAAVPDRSFGFGLLDVYGAIQSLT